MISPPGRFETERFKAAIVRGMGLQFDDARLGFLGEVLQRRLDRLGCPADVYLRELELDAPRDEIAALAQELTVGETYFFRNNEQFRALAEVVLTERVRAGRPPRLLRLLSAGCASGEEAYSMAIVGRETIADPSWQIVVRGVDINPRVLAKAERGRYAAWALRETSPELQRRWFRAAGQEMALDPSLRTAVRFGAGNLVSDDPELWPPAAYDVIFCRNVLMYFAPEQMRAAVARIIRSLAPGGFLFLGHAETLRGISDAFHLRHSHGTFYYELKQAVERALLPPPPAWIREWSGAPSETAAAATPLLALANGAAPPSQSWIDTIRRASERVAALVPAEGPVGAPPLCAEPAWDVAPALNLLRQERFDEALDYVRNAPPQLERDPDMLLLQATLLAHSGQLRSAEDVCLRLLMFDELNAGAHYVLALCREQSGQRDRAGEHDRLAIYLDPAFAMPRLHLGLLARRAGDRGAARRELAQALELLQREDASRILLFGGGFDRRALIGLCASSLRDCGGQP